MNYIVFDLELNSKPFKNRHPNEIIEIGAVKLSEDLSIVDTFQAFVQPKLYKKLFSVVKRKTNIVQQDINEAEDCKIVLGRFKQWIGNDYILCSWGHDDLHHLKMNCKLHHMGSKWVKRHVDLQKQFSEINQLPKGEAFSLKNALSVMDIPINETLHRADVDAKFTAEIFVKVYPQLNLCVEQ